MSFFISFTYLKRHWHSKGPIKRVPKTPTNIVWGNVLDPFHTQLEMFDQDCLAQTYHSGIVRKVDPTCWTMLDPFKCPTQTESRAGWNCQPHTPYSNLLQNEPLGKTVCVTFPEMFWGTILRVKFVSFLNKRASMTTSFWLQVSEVLS